MKTEKEDMYINLPENDFEQVRKTAKEKGITLSAALSVLIARGCESIQDEAVIKRIVEESLSDTVERIKQIERKIVEAIQIWKDEID